MSVEAQVGAFPEVEYNSNQWQLATWHYKNHQGNWRWHEGITYQGYFWNVQEGLPHRFTTLNWYEEHMLSTYHDVSEKFISPWR